MAKAYFLPMPKYVLQKDAQMCWAAALESWLDAVPGQPKYDQDFLLLEARVEGAATAKGSLIKKAGLLWLTNTYAMRFKVYPQSKRLETSDVLKRLKSNGYVYLVWNPITHDSLNLMAHAQVVFGANADYDSLYYMDPWEGIGYDSQRIADYYLDAAEFVLGYPVR